MVAYPPVKIGELQPKPARKALMKTVNTLELGWSRVFSSRLWPMGRVYLPARGSYVPAYNVPYGMKPEDEVNILRDEPEAIKNELE
jgi:hypothetical protein